MEIEIEGHDEEENLVDVDLLGLDLDEVLRTEIFRSGKHTAARRKRFDAKHKTPKAIRKKRSTRAMKKQSKRKNRKK